MLALMGEEDAAKLFGEHVRAKRIAVNLSQEGVQAKSGLSVPTLRKIENGAAKRIAPTTHRKLDAALNQGEGTSAAIWAKLTSGHRMIDPQTAPNRQETAPATLALGPREIGFPIPDFTRLYGAVRRLQDAAATIAPPPPPAFTESMQELATLVERVGVPYWIGVLEANGGPDRELHPIVDQAIGHVLERPVAVADPELRENGMYARWLARRLPAIDAETETRFRMRRQAQALSPDGDR